eukprot:3857716-Pleurochrysis_carterae.AAC.4
MASACVFVILENIEIAKLQFQQHGVADCIRWRFGLFIAVDNASDSGDHGRLIARTCMCTLLRRAVDQDNGFRVKPVYIWSVLADNCFGVKDLVPLPDKLRSGASLAKLKLHGENGVVWPERCNASNQNQLGDFSAYGICRVSLLWQFSLLCAPCS